MLPQQDLGSQSEVIWAIGCSESALQHNPRWFGPLFDVGQSILPHQALLRAHLGDDGREHVLGLLDVAVACQRPGVASVRCAWVCSTRAEGAVGWGHRPGMFCSAFVMASCRATPC